MRLPAEHVGAPEPGVAVRVVEAVSYLAPWGTTNVSARTKKMQSSLLEHADAGEHVPAVLVAVTVAVAPVPALRLAQGQAVRPTLALTERSGNVIPWANKFD